MSHFAQIKNGVVVNVIVAEQDFINSGGVGDSSEWLQTSYNTFGGVHFGQDGLPDNGTAVRKNYAAVGFTYDSVRDAFIPPKPFSSWILNDDTCLWYSPKPYPLDDKEYQWDEAILDWVLVNKG